MVELLHVRIIICWFVIFFFFFQAEDGIRDVAVTGVQTCALPISDRWHTEKLVRAGVSSANLRGRDSRQLPLIAERMSHRTRAGCGQACLEAPDDTQPTRAWSAEGLAPRCQRRSWPSRGLLPETKAWCWCYRESAVPPPAQERSPSPQHSGTRVRP